MTPPEEKGVGAGQGRVCIILLAISYFYRYIYAATWSCHRHTPTCISRRCPGKITEGVGPKVRKSKQTIVHHLYRKRARSTKESRDRLTTPGRSRLLAVKLRTCDYLYADKRAARLCAEQGRKHAPSATNNEIEAVAAAKWARMCVIYTRYTLTCIYIYTISPCAGYGRKQAPPATKQSGSGCKVVKYVRNIYTYIYTGMGYLFFSGHGAREEAGTAGDEIEAVAAAKVVTYGRKFIHIYLYICTCLLYTSPSPRD